MNYQLKQYVDYALNMTKWSFHGCFCLLADSYVNSLVSGCFRGFLEKKRLNARGFAWEFLQSVML